jgi:glycosyltransferase involved in cell wall biosynthesis
MKIVYFVNQYPGISHSFIRREIQALERRGVEIERFAIRPSADRVFSDEDKAEFEKTHHIVAASKLRLLASMTQQFFARPARAVRGLFSAVKLGRCSEAGLFRHVLYYGEALVLLDWMKTTGARHVHAHFGTNAAMIAMLASQIGDISYSLTVHGPEEFEKPKMISLREKVENSSFAVAISQFGAAQLKKITAPDRWSKIHIVHCGIEKSFYESASASLPAEKRFVCVGRLCAEKGQLDLVHAFAKARAGAPDIKLSLIGDGPMRSEIENAIRNHGLADSIFLQGWKSPSDVRAAILGARAFVLPSYAEGLPVSIMEALTLKRPVISTYIAGIPELVGDSVCGWLVPAGDVDALARALTDAAQSDDTLLRQMGEAGFRRATARHDIDIEAGKLVGLFREAVGSAP